MTTRSCNKVVTWSIPMIPRSMPIAIMMKWMTMPSPVIVPNPRIVPRIMPTTSPMPSPRIIPAPRISPSYSDVPPWSPTRKIPSRMNSWRSDYVIIYNRCCFSCFGGFENICSDNSATEHFFSCVKRLIIIIIIIFKFITYSSCCGCSFYCCDGSLRSGSVAKSE